MQNQDFLEKDAPVEIPENFSAALELELDLEGGLQGKLEAGHEGRGRL